MLVSHAALFKMALSVAESEFRARKWLTQMQNMDARSAHPTTNDRHFMTAVTESKQDASGRYRIIAGQKKY